jgi:tripartite-type tricarboxylate transporter receptor subunit TctC
MGFATAISLCAQLPAWAQEFPTQPVRMMVPFPVGAGTDLLARAIGQRLSERWGRALIVDNRAGAGGTIACELVAKSAADGYTLLMGNLSVLGLAPALYPKLAYDPLTSFAPISMVSSSMNVLVVHPALPVNSVNALEKLAKARPGELLYASAGSGTTTHVAAELFRVMSGINFVHIPYKGSPQAMTDLLAGQVHMFFASLASSLPSIRGKRVKPLAVTGLKRSDHLPDLPTFDEAGYRGYEMNAWQAIVAPAGLPRELVTRLNDHVGAAVANTELKERMGALGLAVGGSTPEQLGAYMRAEIVKWSDVVKRSRAKPE